MIFMRIVCWQMILLKYHTLFLSKIRKDVAKFVVCSSCDSPKFEYGLCSINKMATKMVATFEFALVDTLTWSFIPRFLPNFINGLLSSNYCSCLNMGFVRCTIIKIVAKTDIPFHSRALWGPFVGVQLF